MELIPKLHDSLQVIQSNLGPWRCMSIMDWSLDETRGFLVISMQEYWNIGEGRVFDERYRKNAAIALSHLREKYEMLEIRVPVKRSEEKVTYNCWLAFVSPDYETKMLIRSLDSLMAYVAPDYTGKKELEWKFPQLKLGRTIKKGDRIQKLKTIGEVFKRFKNEEQDMTTWKVDYFGSENPETEEEWTYKKGDIKKVQMRWTENLESGKLTNVSPQNGKFLDNNRAAVIVGKDRKEELWKRFR
ncbi:unnamed protein product [Oikopleura dioica]|uniref:Uncharacterized protein n=1 Tax=Oikopleura dioica TaxID=34765 RepID=E4XQC5_OIKDI|nr:unnamed protein product [Oikopleura dioica]